MKGLSFLVFLLLVCKTVTLNVVTLDSKTISLNTSEKAFSSSFFTSSRNFSDFYGGKSQESSCKNIIQIKVFGGKTNGTTLAILLIKITVHSSSTCSRIVTK